ncbi:MAG: hypothetical protein LBJ19_00630 [Holosporaceae bacterium]|jgi:hypothetical protein|nr:hypothetical protein [Holosporaceae bacterium]
MKNSKKVLVLSWCWLLQGCAKDDFSQNSKQSTSNYENTNIDNYLDDDIRILEDISVTNHNICENDASMSPDTIEVMFREKLEKKKKVRKEFSEKQIAMMAEPATPDSAMSSISTSTPIIPNASTEKTTTNSEKDSSTQIIEELGKEKLDNVSRYLAGMYAPDYLGKKEEFVNYSKVIESKFSELMSSSLGMVKSWSGSNILDRIADHQTVFYPFGGPDVAYALEFFPDAKTYILVGLEPIGNFDGIIKAIGNPGILPLLTKSLSTYLSKGFFITSEMSNQLTNKSIRGTLPLMLIQLSRLGFTLEKIENIKIGTSGNVGSSENGIDCVKISCTRNIDAAPKVIYYVRTNLSNDNPRLDNLFQLVKKSNFITFIKSASYALHDKSLSKLKQFIIINASAILQDDSGIPFSSFDETWERNVFGTYTGPTLKIFKNYLQEDLLEFHKNHTGANIPFKIGYGFQQGRPNLLLAISSAKNNRTSVKSADKNAAAEETPLKEKARNEKSQKTDEVSDVKKPLSNEDESSGKSKRHELEKKLSPSRVH